MNYAARLAASVGTNNTNLCLGIDPLVGRLPAAPGLSIRDRVVGHVDTAIDLCLENGCAPAAVKPNIGYFHRLDRPHEHLFDGSSALADCIALVRARLPEAVVILDSKRGDIAQSSENYAVEAFDCWQADAVTVSPFMGEDSVGPFARRATEVSGCVYALNRTSNPGAARLQEPLRVAEAIQDWSKTADKGAVGAVIGATDISDLQALLKLHSRSPIPVLIPGVGAQGGSAEDIRAATNATLYPTDYILVNVSRAALFPWGTNPAPTWRTELRDALLTWHRACRLGGSSA